MPFTLYELNRRGEKINERYFEDADSPHLRKGMGMETKISEIKKRAEKGEPTMSESCPKCGYADIYRSEFCDDFLVCCKCDYGFTEHQQSRIADLQAQVEKVRHALWNLHPDFPQKAYGDDGDIRRAITRLL